MREETKVKVREELGRVSGIFMSQGGTRAGDIVMPTEQLIESAERIDAIINQAIQQEREPIVEDPKTRERIEKILRKFGTTIDPQGVDDGDFETAIDDIIILISK